MKKIVTCLGILFISLGFIFAGPGPKQETARRGTNWYPGDFSGFFQLQEETPLRVSIDWGWERNGSIPVVVSFCDLDIITQVEARELAETETVQLETRLNQLLVGNTEMNLSFRTYEQNPLRTRMETAERLPIRLKIDARGRLDIWVSGRPLKLEQLLAVFKKPAASPSSSSSPGAPVEWVECMIMGPNVITHRCFVFVPGRGVIYTASRLQRDLENLDINTLPLPGNGPGEEPAPRMRDDTSWTIWAVKTPGVEREEKNVGPNRNVHKDRH